MSRTGGRPYRRAVATLKARGQTQQCWRCGKTLYADLPPGHPDSITLGHLIAIEDGGHLTDPGNHAAECPKCNYGDGARRTNAKKAGTSTNPNSYRNPNW